MLNVNCTRLLYTDYRMGNMQTRLENRQDVEKLVNAFYAKVLADETIGHIFTEVARLDFDLHMPVMYSFWETTLLGRLSYKGNPMAVHIRLDKKIKLTETHFNRWLELFNETVDELFEGEKANEAKSRATQIRHLMQYKVEQSRSTSL